MKELRGPYRSPEADENNTTKRATNYRWGDDGSTVSSRTHCSVSSTCSSYVEDQTQMAESATKSEIDGGDAGGLPAFNPLGLAVVPTQEETASSSIPANINVQSDCQCVPRAPDTHERLAQLNDPGKTVLPEGNAQDQLDTDLNPIVQECPTLGSDPLAPDSFPPGLAPLEPSQTEMTRRGDKRTKKTKSKQKQLAPTEIKPAFTIRGTETEQDRHVAGLIYDSLTFKGDSETRVGDQVEYGEDALDFINEKLADEQEHFPGCALRMETGKSLHKIRGMFDFLPEVELGAGRQNSTSADVIAARSACPDFEPHVNPLHRSARAASENPLYVAPVCAGALENQLYATENNCVAHFGHVILCGYEDAARIRHHPDLKRLLKSRPGLNSTLTSDGYVYYLNQGGDRSTPLFAKTDRRKDLRQHLDHGAQDNCQAAAVVIPIAQMN